MTRTLFSKSILTYCLCYKQQKNLKWCIVEVGTFSLQCNTRGSVVEWLEPTNEAANVQFAFEALEYNLTNKGE